MTGALESPPAPRAIGHARGRPRYPSPLALLDAAKSGDPAAYDALILVFERIRHPSLFAARSREDRREIARELVHEYLASSATWTSERLLEVKSISLFRRDLEKFFFGYEIGGATLPGAEARAWLKQKLDRVLASPRFEKLGGDRGRTARYRLSDRPEIAPIAADDADLVERLPRLRPRMDGARGDRLPSYASDAEMDALMTAIFELNGNVYTYKKRLIAIALQCFEPPLEAFEYHLRLPSSELMTLNDAEVNIEFEADLERYEGLLDALLSDEERALLSCLELRGTEAARLFGVSAARISQRRDALRARLLDFAEAHQLCRREMSLLLGTYLARMELRHAR